MTRVTRTGLVVAALLMTGCHRTTASDAPDADADLRARTAAKTLSDLAAADAAARTPLPQSAPRRPEPSVGEPRGRDGQQDAPDLPDTSNTSD